MPDDTLETLGAAAATWRATRDGQGKGQRIPEKLKQRAVDLLANYSAKEIARAVQVSDPRVVKEWRGRYDRVRKRSGALPATVFDQPSFVEVSLPIVGLAAAVSAQTAEMQVELESRGGLALRLRGGVDAELVLSLAKLVMQGAVGARP